MNRKFSVSLIDFGVEKIGLKAKKIEVTVCFLLIIFVSSCRTNSAAANSANLFSRNENVFTSPTSQPIASPPNEAKIGAYAEKKLQENFAEKIPKSGQKIEDFIPSDSSLIQRATDDLDKDGKEDGAIIVLNKTSEVFELEGRITPANQYKQFLIIVLRGENEELKLQTYSSKVLFPLNSDNAGNSTAEIKIKDGKILLNQIRAFNDEMSVYENSIKKIADDWQIVTGRVITEIPQKKIYKGGFRKIDVFETTQKTPISLVDFDIEKVELKWDKKIKTY